MRTDRELLELAAKAAAVGPLDFDYAEREGHGFHMGPRLPMPQGVLMAAMWTYWNPLEDDSDALRLAVTLKLDIVQFSTYEEVQVVAPLARVCSQLWGDDAYAATRRAIVRAAAEIGAASPDPQVQEEGEKQ